MAATPQFSLSKQPPAVRYALGAVMFVLIGAVYWVALYTDVSSKITATENQRKTLDAQLAQTKVAQAGYVQDKADLGNLQLHEKELNKALPGDTQIAAFLASIQQVSNVSGVDLNAWQPLEEKTETFYAKVPMKLELNGRFFQIAKFAFEVGKLERIINIENIEISDAKSEGDEIHLKARCLATTFHTPKSAAKPADSAAANKPGAPQVPAPPATGTPK